MFLNNNKILGNNQNLVLNLISKIFNFRNKSLRFKHNYVYAVKFDSDKEYYSLFNFNFLFKFSSVHPYLILSESFDLHNNSVMYLNFRPLIFRTYFITRKDKVLFIRAYLYLSQFRYLIKKFKKVKFKKKKKIALFFFRNKKFFVFIKLRRRFLIYRKWKKWKLKTKRRIYKATLKALLDSTRRRLDTFLFNQLSKKRFLINNYLYKNRSYNLNLNLTPFNFFKKHAKLFIFKNLNVFKNRFFPKLFVFFSSNFLERLTDQKLFFKIHTNPKLTNFEKLWINYFFKKFFYIQRQFKGVLHLQEFIYILLLSFKHKDLFFLKNWLINFLEKINLKKHKTFLKSFKKIALTVLNSSAKFLRVKGFLFDIRGKVGVSGNAKKRHLSIKYKCYSFTSIKLRADQVKFLVRTNTGVLGSTLVITY